MYRLSPHDFSLPGTTHDSFQCTSCIRILGSGLPFLIREAHFKYSSLKTYPWCVHTSACMCATHSHTVYIAKQEVRVISQDTSSRNILNNSEMPRSGEAAVILVCCGWSSFTPSPAGIGPLHAPCGDLWVGECVGAAGREGPQQLSFIPGEAGRNGLRICLLPPGLSASQQAHSNLDGKLQGFYFPRVVAEACLASEVTCSVLE